MHSKQDTSVYPGPFRKFFVKNRNGEGIPAT